MPKRRTHNSDDRFGAEDNPIGLTGAFAPVKGPQSVDYDEKDDPVGLTQAFGAIPEDEEPHAWDEAGKGKDFDWDAALGEPVGDYSKQDEDDEPAAVAENASKADAPDEAPVQEEAKAESESQPASDSAPEPESEPESDKPAPALEVPVAAAKPSGSGPKHGRHAAPAPELSPRMKKSRRTRRVLIVLVILLIIVIGVLGYFMYRTFSNSQQEAAQQAQEQTASPRADIANAPAVDAPDSTSKLADVPNLTTLLGKSQDQAISDLRRGALVTSNRAVNEEGNPIKVNLNVALTDEPADSKTGTPTVYLGLGEANSVLQAGYSASASALGFGQLSFADAVNNEHVVEKTLAEVGVNVPEGSAVLPANKDEYSTYGSDGTTVVRERSSFEGATEVNGAPATWSAVLSYDYTTQVVTGNLNDTVRIIYVYITLS